MKDESSNLDPTPKKPQKKGNKIKNKISLRNLSGTTLPTLDEETQKIISNVIQNSVDKYAKIADNQLKDSREDFNNLQPIVSEFLDEFIIIGHTLEGQRAVMRYTKSPADDDKLTELCKRVLVKMLIQEQHGE